MTAYTDYATYLSRFFDGKVQKLPVDAGFTCPNRDGSKGLGGCAYCNNEAFSPLGARGKSVTLQIEEGKRFFSHKYRTTNYLAYFQSYTGTYCDIDRLMELYKEALAVPSVVGLIIGTRPDTMPQELLDSLALLGRDKYIMIEYGGESSHDSTLQSMNRCHTWADTTDAIERTKEAGLHVGLHLIMGLPGESHEMMLETVRRSCELRPDVIKFHQLQILHGTLLEARAADIETFTLEGYLDLCAEITLIVPHDIAIGRFTASAPSQLLIAPRWGIKNSEFVKLLKKRISL